MIAFAEQFAREDKQEALVRLARKVEDDYDQKTESDLKEMIHAMAMEIAELRLKTSHQAVVSLDAVSTGQGKITTSKGGL